jgi:hypothetical protein
VGVLKQVFYPVVYWQLVCLIMYVIRNIIMARSQSQIVKSIESFAKTGAQQWDKAAYLSFEVVSHYWGKGNGDSSLIVQLDAILPRINGNIAKAFRLVVAEYSPVKLCKDVTDEEHGISSKNKRKKLVKANEVGMLLDALATGEGVALKAFLPKAKDAKPRVVKSFADTLKANAVKFMDDEQELSASDAQAALEQLAAMYAKLQSKIDAAAELLELDNMEAPEGLEAAAA